MTQPPFDDSRYLPIPGERRFVVPLLAGVTAGYVALSILILVLSAGSETFPVVLVVLVVTGLLMLVPLSRAILARRAYLRDRAYGRVIDRLPGRATGTGDHEGPNLAR